MEVVKIDIKKFSNEDMEDMLSSPTELKNISLQLKSQKLMLQKGFEKLLCLSEINIEPKHWQTETAIKALRDMQGSAILADEVGLGKTIEAGLIMKELLHRGLIKSILILVPAPLIEQWKEEMKEKFDIEFVDFKERNWYGSSFIISSMPYASRSSTRRSQLQEYGFDLVVVDEAHCLKNQNTKTYKFAYGIKRKNTLLMSATPIQNDMKELFNLVNVLKPGYFKSRRMFNKEYVYDRFTPKNIKKLRRLISEVMIRHKRSNTLVELPRRKVHNIEIDLKEEERVFHDSVIEFVKEIYREKGLSTGKSTTDILVLVGLLKQNCSSPQSVVGYLEKNILEKLSYERDIKRCKEIISLGNEIKVPSKAEIFIDNVKTNSERCIIYTEFLGTVSMLKKVLENNNIKAKTYHGGLSRAQKHKTLKEFKDNEFQVLISTESGAQGLNIQFCNQLYNYDLPWNPMRVEQRIGRVHRFGQKSAVDIYNITTKGTIDEYVLYVLTSKINLFEMVIGELDTIMSYMINDSSSLEVKIGKIILESSSTKEIEERLRKIGDDIVKAKSDFNSDLKESQKILDSIGVEEE